MENTINTNEIDSYFDEFSYSNSEYSFELILLETKPSVGIFKYENKDKEGMLDFNFLHSRLKEEHYASIKNGSVYFEYQKLHKFGLELDEIKKVSLYISKFFTVAVGWHNKELMKFENCKEV